MDGFGRKIVKTVMMVGAIAVGFAANSTDSKAEELEAPSNQAEQTEMPSSQAELPEVENVPTEQSYVQEEAQNEDPRIREMEDAAGVIEGDIVAAEGYLEEANEAVEEKTLTEEKSEEILSGAEAVQEQADEKSQIILGLAETIWQQAERAEYRFKEEADFLGLIDYYYRYIAATDPEEKERIYNEALAATNYGKAEQEYNELGEQLNELEEQRKVREEEALKNLEEIEKEYSELQELEKDIASEEVGSLGSEQGYYQEQVYKLNQLKTEMDESCEEFDQVYYARAEREENVQTTEADKQEAIQNVKDAVSSEADDEELSEKITYCATAIDLYNQAVEQLEKWYTQLEEALVKRRDTISAYNAQNEYVKSIEQSGILEKIARYMDLRERYSDSSILDAAKNAYAEALSDSDQHEVKNKRDKCWDTMQDSLWEYDSFKSTFDDYIEKNILWNKADPISGTAQANCQKLKNITTEIKNVIASYVPEESTLEKISKAVDEMKQLSEEINDAETLEEAEKKHDAVHDNYDVIEDVVETLAKNFSAQAKEAGFGEYADELKSAKTNEEKLTIIDKISVAIDEKLDSIAADVISGEYDHVVANIIMCESQLSETIAELNKAGKNSLGLDNVYDYLCYLNEKYADYLSRVDAVKAEIDELSNERDAALREIWEEEPVSEKIAAREHEYYEKLNEMGFTTPEDDFSIENIVNYSDRDKRDSILSAYVLNELCGQGVSYYWEKYKNAQEISSRTYDSVATYYANKEAELNEKLRETISDCDVDLTVFDFYNDTFRMDYGHEYISEVKDLVEKLSDLTNKRYEALLHTDSTLNAFNETLQELKTSLQLNEKADTYLAEADSNYRHAENVFADDSSLGYIYNTSYQFDALLNEETYALVKVNIRAYTRVLPTQYGIGDFQDLLEKARGDITAYFNVELVDAAGDTIASTEQEIEILV